MNWIKTMRKNKIKKFNKFQRIIECVKLENLRKDIIEYNHQTIESKECV